MQNILRKITLLATAAPLALGAPAHANHNWCHNESTDIWLGIVGADPTADPGFGVCVGDQAIFVNPTLNNVQVRLCDFSTGTASCTELVEASHSRINLLGPCVYDLTVVVDGISFGPRDVGVC